MKQFFMILLLMAALVNGAMAAEYTVEWGYTPPSEPAVTGFRLYKNNVQLIDFSGSSMTTGVFTDTLVVGDMFELTALFADSTESPRSAQFTWTGGSFIRFGRFKAGNTSGHTDRPGQVLLR